MNDEVNVVGFGLPSTLGATSTVAVDAGGAAPPVITGEPDAPATVAHETTSEVQAANPANPQDGSLTPEIAAAIEATPHEPIAPNWFQHIEVEGLACIRSVYDFGSGLGAEVVEFIKGSRHRVTPVRFKGVEINNYDYVGNVTTHATPELAQACLATLKESAQ